jgi:hypothetical protein
MNVVYPQLNPITARTCGRNEKTCQKVAYAISEESHTLCMDKKYMIQAQIEACDILLNYVKSNPEKKIIEKEINELRSALDLMS